MILDTIPLDQIQPPERSDKLHPYENEDDEEWGEFCSSVGSEPNKPLEVAENGTGYELIDGDRRYRALTENEADTAACFILEDGEDLSERERESEKTMRMITANEFRKDSDPEQKARAVAKFCAPHLLLPGDRITDERMMTQGEVADKVGRAQPRISVWLNPLRDMYPLRDALAGKASGNYPDVDAVQTIDETLNYLLRGGQDGSLVVPEGQENFVANEIADMQGVGLNEIRNEAEKAAQKGWNENRFLKTLQKDYAYDETEAVKEDIEKGRIEENLPAGFEDDAALESSDGPSQQKVEPDSGKDQAIAPPKPTFESSDIDWSEYVSDDDLNGAQTVSQIETRRMMSQSVEDDGAVGIRLLCDITGMSESEVMREVVDPMIADYAVSWLQENV